MQIMQICHDEHSHQHNIRSSNTLSHKMCINIQNAHGILFSLQMFIMKRSQLLPTAILIVAILTVVSFLFANYFIQFRKLIYRFFFRFYLLSKFKQLIHLETSEMLITNGVLKNLQQNVLSQ